MKPAVRGRGRRVAGGFLAALALFVAVLAAAPPEAQAQSESNFCSRTGEVVARIRRSLSLLPAECTADLSRITGTFLINNVTSLRSGDFDGMSGVTNLLITSSPNLTSLPTSPFDEMTSLTQLNILAAPLTSLPTGMFDNLDGLTRIWLPRLFTLYVKPELHEGRVRARIDEAAPLPVSVTWTASGGASGAATIAAGERTSAVFGAASSQDVTITLSSPSFTGVSESTSDSAGGEYRNFQLDVAVGGASATIPGSTMTLALSPASIAENGGVATVTASLSGALSEATTVTVSAAAGAGAADADFTLSASATLTIAAGAMTSTGTVTVTANPNTTDSPDKSVTVSGTATGGDDVADPSDVTLTITDDDAAPGVVLSLNPSSVSENGGTSAVSATLSHPSSEPSTVTVTAVSGFYTVGDATITIAAGDTTAATDTATVTAVDDAVHQGSAGRSGTVTATLTNGQGAGAVTGATLTLTDHGETLPTVALVLSEPDASSPDTITETGGVSTVTATLSGASSEAVTVTVAAAEVAASGAVAADFDLSSATTLTIAAGDTTSTGTVTVTANGNDVDSPDKSVTVSGTTTGGNSVVHPPDVTLTITDDDAAPTVTLSLNPPSVSENGGTSTVSATLSHPSSEPSTVTVTAVSSFYTVGDATITIPAGDTTAATDTATVTAVNDTVHQGSAGRSGTVTATLTNGQGAGAVTGATLTLTDHGETLPTVALVLSEPDASSPDTISETGGVSTVTATLSGASSAAVTVTVAATAGTGAVAADFGLSSTTTLTIAAGDVTSTGTVTVTANGNDVDSPDKSVTVSGTATGGNSVAHPPDVTLTITDDEDLPTVALVLAPSSITEDGGVSAVTATLSGASSEAVTVTVSAAAGTGAVMGDFNLSGATTLTIAAGDVTSTGTVTVTAVDNPTDAPNKTVTVSGRAAGGNSVANPSDATLTITDDDAAPTVTLALSATSIAEDGGVSTVTATLDRPSSEATTVTVTAAEVATTGAVAADFDLSSATTLTIAAGVTTSAGTVTVTAVDNTTDAPDKQVRVSGTAANSQGATSPSDVTLTITDDDAAPGVALVLAPASISETGGVSTVTATLSGPSSEATTVTVAAAAVGPAVAGDFGLSAATTLTIAAGDTTSTGTVTVTANGNTVDSPNKSVTVSGTATGGNSVAHPPDVTLTITDDEDLPTVALVLAPSSITEDGGVSAVTATLSGASSEAVTVTVAAAEVAASGAVAGDFNLSGATTLTIASGDVTSTGTVTVTAVDNPTDAPNKTVTVSGRAAGGNSVANPPDATLTITDDDAAPTVTLALSATSIAEDGGVSTVTATLDRPSSEATTVTVAAAEVATTGAVAGDFNLSSATTLTIAAGVTTSTGTVTVTAVDNPTDAPNKQVRVSGTAANSQGATSPSDVTLTITDDDAAPGVALVLAPASISETGGVSTVTATLSGPSSEATTVTVTAAAVGPAVAGDFALSNATTLTIAAGDTTSTGTVTVTANGNTTDAPDKSVTVSGTATGGNSVAHPSSETLTITDDDTAPTVTLSLNPPSVSENGGTSTVSATLSHPSSEPSTVTVTAVSGFYTVGDATITIPAGDTTAATDTATVTAVNDAVHQGSAGRSGTVTATLANGQGTGAVTGATLTLTDHGETLPTVALVLSPTSISETGGVSTVTATLSGASSAAVTVTVSASAGTGAVAADFGLSSATTLTIAAGDVTSTGTVTVTANGNTVDSPNKSVTVSGTATGGNSVADPPDVTLTITDDEDLPTVALVLAPSSITEDGGVSAVTATLSGASSEAVTVTISAAAGTGAVQGDFTLSATTTLTIAAGSMTSTGTVTVTAVDNTTDAPNKTVTVSGTAAGGNSVANPPDATLTITDDDAAPTVTLALSATSIAEDGGVSTVTATLDRPSSEATTVTVAAAEVTTTGAVAADFDLSSATTLTIAAGVTTSAGTVTVTAVDNTTDAPDKQVRVSGTAVNSQGATSPSDVTLTIPDDDAAPTVTLSLNPSSVSENGGTSTVSATLSHPSSEPSTVTVTAVSGLYTVGDATITIPAGDTTAATDTATVTAVNDTVHQGSAGRSGTVTATLANGQGTGAVTGATLTLTDHGETLPTVALVLSPTSISETGGVSTVTATLSGASSAAVTVTVSASAGTGAVAADFGLSSATTLTIAAGDVTSTGTVTVTANGNTVDSPNKSVTVSGTATGGNSVADPPDVTLTITDDEDLPTVALVLAPSSITEDGGVSAVTATLSGASSEAVTVTVSAAAGTGAVQGDFTLSATTTLTIAAGSMTSTGTVTVTAADNPTDAPNKTVTVSGTAAGGNSVTNPSDATLTITDDDAAPTVTLALSATSIAEDGGVSTVTATLDRPSSEATTVTVAAAEVATTGAVAGDFNLSSARTLTIAAGVTTSTGTVTVTAVDNTTDAPNKQVRVSGTAANSQGATSPSDVTLTIPDDDAAPGVALVLAPASISETGGVSTVTATLSGPSSEATTVTVTAAAVGPAVAGDFALSNATTLTIAAGDTTSTGTVTVTANGNTTDAPDKSVTVSGTATGGNSVADPPDETLTITDDDAAPTVTLSLNPPSVSENGGTSTVSATLSHPSSEPSTVTVTAVSGFYTVGDATITIPAGDTTAATDTATVTAVNDAVHQGSAGRSGTVTATLANGQGTGAVTGATLTLTDHGETLPTVALVLSEPDASSPDTISETGGVSTVTATLSGASSAAVTVTVSASAGTGAVAGDFDLSSARTLTIAAGDVTSTGTVTVTANGNDVDSPDKSVTVSGTATGGNNVAHPPNVTLTITDDEDLPTVALVLAPSSITEDGGVSAVTATLSGASSEAVTVTVAAAEVAASGAVAGDFNLSGATTLTIAAGDVTSTGTVTVTAVDNTTDAPNKTVTVSGRAAGGNSVANPSSETLTITDDDAAPTVALALSATSIAEDGGVSTVTATLDRPSSEATTVTVAAAEVTTTGAVAADFDLSSATTLTIAAGVTTSTGTVTVTAVDNPTDAPNKQVRVSGTAANSQGATNPSDVTLTIPDDDAAPGVVLSLNPASVSENGGTSAVSATLSHPSSEPSTVTVTAVSGFYTVGDATITIAAGDTTAATDTATVTAVNDTVHQGSAGRSGTVTATLTNGQGAGAVTGATLTLTDHGETLPTVALVLSEPDASSPDTISETGGVSTVTATLSGASSAAVTVTVAATAGTGAVAADFGLSSATTLIIAAGDVTSTGTVTVTANGNDVDSPDKSVTVSGTAAGGNSVVNPPNVTLTITDDEDLPTVALVLAPSSITEDGGVSAVTATLSGASSEAVTVTVSAAAGTGAVAGDFNLSSATTLTIAAGDVTSTGTVTVTAVDNTTDAPNKTVTVSGRAAGGNSVANPSDATLTITDDDAAPTVTLALSATSIAEDGGVSTVTATLDRPSSEATTVTVAAAEVATTGAVAGDFNLSSARTLTIAAGVTTSTGTVTVTAVDNPTDAPNKQVRVSGTAANGQGATSPSDVTLTITDDDAAPGVALVLAPASISETGGVSTVTATLSGPSSEATTVTVTAAAVGPAVAGDFGLSNATTLTIAAGDTTSTGTVTVTANGNTTDAPDKSVTVSGTATGGNSVAHPPDVTLTITDDEDLPTVALVLAPSSITEDGGVSAVTATLSGASSEAVTVTISAAAGTGAVMGDFNLSSVTTLTIAAGSMTSTGTVTVTAVDNTTDAPNKTVTVSGRAAGGNSVANPSDATLTITDDDAAPTVTLALSATSIAEDGGVSTVTATLDRPSSEATTVTVAAAEVATTGAVAGDFNLSSATTLTIAAGVTTSTGTVTVTAVDNTTDAPNKQVRVSGTAANSQGATSPSNVTLAITDDDAAPGVVLSLNPPSVSENGGTSAVSATLSHPSSEATTVTVTEAAGFYTVGLDATITIAAGDTTAAADTATVTAVNDAVHQGSAGRSVTVTATLANGQGTGTVTGASLTLADDETRPTAALVLSPTSISETGGVSTVTATLSGVSSQATTLTVAAAAVGPAVAGDFDLSSATTLTIAAGDTTSTGTVTVTANGNTVDAPDKSVTVSGMATGGNSVAHPPDVTLTITDDEDLPTVALVLAPSSITEDGGVSAVTATLSGASSEAVTVTVAAAEVAASGAVAGDFNLSGATTLTIAAGDTTSTGTVTVTAVDNTTDAPNKTVTVSGRAAGGNSVANPSDATLTITDDDAAPTVTLALSATSIAEDGGVSTVTATLDRPSSEATTVTVAAAEVATTGAVAGDFNLSSARTLTIAAGVTTSTGTVTVTAVDNTTDAPNKQVRVSGTAANSQGATSPSDVTLAITDDDAAPGVVLSLNPSSVSENGGTSTVSATLSHPSSEPSTVTVTAVSGFYTVGDATITIAAGDTTAATDTATITAVNDTVHQGSAGRSGTVTATLANDQGAGAVTGAALTLTDDETRPTAALVLSPDTISETGGVSTVTATLSGVSSEAVTVTVAAAAGTGAVTADFDLSSATTLTIAAGDVTSTGTVTVTANGNNVDSPDKSVTVSGTATGGNDVVNPPNVTLTITDDEDLPTATLVLTPPAILENGGVGTVTATLSHPSSEATTLTVAAAPGTGAVQGDFTLSAATTLTIAAETTTSAGTVTVTANDNADASGSKQVTVSATASGGRGVVDPSSATLILRDDELGLAESAVSGQATEEGGQATFTVALNVQPSAAVTVSVTSQDTSEGLVSAGDGAPVATTTLTFAPAAWNTAQTVTVTGVDDDVDDGDVTWQVRLDPASGDTDYDRLANVDVDVTTTDDDTAGVEVSPATTTTNRLVTTEDEGEATFTVTLASEPLGDVVLDVASDDTGEGTVDTDSETSGLQAILTFTAGDWDSAQTVTVAGVDDTAADGDQDYTVTLVVNQTATADATYDGLGTVSVLVVNRDNDATADVNGDGSIGPLDGLLMYYAYTFRAVFELETDLGQRVRGFLRTLRSPTSSYPANDTGYKAMLQAAWDWQSANPDRGDVNGDGSIGPLDGLLMYYAYTFEAVFRLETDLGRRVRGFLRTLRSPTSSYPATDAGYKAMLDIAWQLRGPSS